MDLSLSGSVSMKYSSVHFFIISFDLLILTSEASPPNKLEFLSGCTCPGYDIFYKCTVCGDDTTTTVWEGTAFHCQGNSDEISLRHSQFTIQPETGDCSDGLLVAYAIGVEEQSCYISQLNATVSTNLNGTTIMCAFEVQDSSQIIINTSTVEITADPPSPPTNLMLRNASQDQLVFTWTPAILSCQAVHYIINSTNCGSCPNITTSTSVTCSDLGLTSNKTVCRLDVKTVVCDDLVSGIGQNIQVITKVPHSPTNIKIVPIYHYNNKELIKLNVSFSGEMDLYNVSDIIPSSAISYNIIFEENSSTCDTTVIPSSLCKDGACKGVVINTPSSCMSSDEVKISIYGTNLFGDGPISSRITVDTAQQIVDIRETSTVIFLCNFSSLFVKGARVNNTCSIVYGPQPALAVDNCVLIYSASTTIFEDDTTKIELNSIQGNTAYCFVVTVTSNNIVIAIIEGTFLSKTIPGSSVGTIVGAIVGIAATFLVVVIVILILARFYCRSLKKPQRSEELDLQLTFTTDSGTEKINPISDDHYEELSLDDFAVHDVRVTCMIETFMNTNGYEKTYKPFKGNTYYEFVEDEELDDQLEVILMYTPQGENMAVPYRLFKAYVENIPLRTQENDSKMRKPPKIKESGWRVFLQSFDGKKFIRRNRSQLPDNSKEHLDSDVDVNEQLMFIIDKSVEC